MSSPQAFNSNVAGSQFNLGDITVNQLPPAVTNYVSPRRFNGAPIDLLTASEGRSFIGRLDELSFLSQVFNERNVSTEENVPTHCAVYGKPGVGKTKLVLRFAQMVFAQSLYSYIFWMSGATTDKLIEGMAKILDIVGHQERMRSEHSAILTAARLWLEDPQSHDDVRWLIILDNVDTSVLEFLSKHLPQRNAKGNILFTTRSADVADALVRVSGRHHSTLEICVPDLMDTTHLFFASAGIDAITVTPTQKDQAEELVQTLGSLPLAVVQAASYMKQSAMTLDKMLQISKSERKTELIGWMGDLAEDHQRSVAATFDTLLDQLEEDFPETYDVLRVLSFLDPEDIPLSMITDGAQISSSPLDEPLPGNSQRESGIIPRMAKWTHVRRPSQQHSRSNTSDSSDHTDPLPELRFITSLILSPAAFSEAQRKLQSLSLVESLSHDEKPSLRMHDLVHFLTREHVKRHWAHQAWFEAAASLVCGALRRVENPRLPQSWPECERLMPHVRSLSTACTGVQGVNLELVSADVHLARYLNSRGRYGDAEKLCERSVGILRKELGEKHRDTLVASSILAQTYDNQGRFADAEATLKHVFAIEKKELGTDHHDTLETMNDLALVCLRRHRYKEAEDLYKRILVVNEKKLDPDHRTTFAAMNNLATVYISQKRYDAAEKLFKHVLSCVEKIFGPDHIHTLTSVHNLALVYRLQANYVHAEELFMRVLVGREKRLGPSHLDTLKTTADLALVYQLQGRNGEAERLFLRSFTGMKQQLGAHHPDTLWCTRRFADFYQSLGRNDEVDALLEGK